jgi:hypothetical protein
VGHKLNFQAVLGHEDKPSGYHIVADAFHMERTADTFPLQTVVVPAAWMLSWS